MWPDAAAIDDDGKLGVNIVQLFDIRGYDSAAFLLKQISQSIDEEAGVDAVNFCLIAFDIATR